MEEKQFNLHPIQLRTIKVLELSILVLQDHAEKEPSPHEEEFNLYHGSSMYDPKDKVIAVKVGTEIGKNITNAPFQLKVELIGVFDVDDHVFPIDKIALWAKQNAPLLLYPYLREHVYSLTLRAGVRGVLLPLLHLPSLKFSPKIDDVTDKKTS